MIVHIHREKKKKKKRKKRVERVVDRFDGHEKRDVARRAFAAGKAVALS